MLADVHRSPPRCPKCRRPMRLVHVLSNKHVYPPVRTFERAGCQTDAIWQWHPTQVANRRPSELKRAKPGEDGA
jgi:hypothetical protein